MRLTLLILLLRWQIQQNFAQISRLRRDISSCDDSSGSGKSGSSSSSYSSVNSADSSSKQGSANDQYMKMKKLSDDDKIFGMYVQGRLVLRPYTKSQLGHKKRGLITSQIWKSTLLAS